MSTPSRREKLESMLADDPSDSFLRYALAMELQKESEHDRSLELLDGLMADSPPHLPAFFMAGQQLAALEQIEKAKSVLGRGIEEAQRQGDEHAQAEMTDFLGGL